MYKIVVVYENQIYIVFFRFVPPIDYNNIRPLPPLPQPLQHLDCQQFAGMLLIYNFVQLLIA